MCYIVFVSTQERVLRRPILDVRSRSRLQHFKYVSNAFLLWLLKFVFPRLSLPLFKVFLFMNTFGMPRMVFFFFLALKDLVGLTSVVIEGIGRIDLWVGLWNWPLRWFMKLTLSSFLFLATNFFFKQTEFEKSTVNTRILVAKNPDSYSIRTIWSGLGIIGHFLSSFQAIIRKPTLVSCFQMVNHLNTEPFNDWTCFENWYLDANCTYQRKNSCCGPR